MVSYSVRSLVGRAAARPAEGGQLPLSSFVTLKVYDVLGSEVKTLVDEEKPPGRYSVTFNASNLPSGIYFCRITADKFSDVKKLVLVK